MRIDPEVIVDGEVCGPGVMCFLKDVPVGEMVVVAENLLAPSHPEAISIKMVGSVGELENPSADIFTIISLKSGRPCDLRGSDEVLHLPQATAVLFGE